MRLRHVTLALALVLLATFTLRAQNGQNGYWPPSGPTQEKLYINSGEGDINNLTIDTSNPQADRIRSYVTLRERVVHHLMEILHEFWPTA